jgi:hypothetical protein
LKLTLKNYLFILELFPLMNSETRSKGEQKTESSSLVEQQDEEFRHQQQNTQV